MSDGFDVKWRTALGANSLRIKLAKEASNKNPAGPFVTGQDIH